MLYIDKMIVTEEFEKQAIQELKQTKGNIYTLEFFSSTINSEDRHDDALQLDLYVKRAAAADLLLNQLAKCEKLLKELKKLVKSGVIVTSGFFVYNRCYPLGLGQPIGSMRFYIDELDRLNAKYIISHGRDDKYGVYTFTNLIQ